MNDIREKLKALKTPVVIYGTGNGADRLIDDMNNIGVKISGVFASDGFVRKRVFRGFEVGSFDSMYTRFPDMTVLMCFGSDRADVRANIEKISARVPLFFPEYPVYGNSIFNSEFAEKHSSELEYIRENLADEQSVKTFDCLIKFRLTGELKYLFECESDNEPEMNVKNNSVFLDLGAYSGDTAIRFASANGEYGGIVAVEPDARNFRKLTENTVGIKNITVINAAAGDTDGIICWDAKKGRGAHAAKNGKAEVRGVTVDTLAKDINDPIIIKADVEGNELAVINGAKETILKKRPTMRIACYHRSEDFFTLPQAVLCVRDDYKIYMRHKTGVPSWDTEFFFI